MTRALAASAIELRIGKQYEVDFQSRSWMQHVELMFRLHSLPHRIFAYVEITRGEFSTESSYLFLPEINDDIDIVSESRLAVGNRGRRSRHQIRDGEPVEGLTRVAEQVNRLHETISAPVRGRSPPHSKCNTRPAKGSVASPGPSATFPRQCAIVPLLSFVGARLPSLDRQSR